MEPQDKAGKDKEITMPRLLVLTGEVNWAMVEKTAEQMAVFNALSSAPIIVHITSPGGMLDPAMAIYDLLLLSDSPVVTCVFGCAGSSASIIALAGARRLIAPNANIMIHTGSLGLEGRFKEKDFDELHKGARDNNERVYRLYASRTGNDVAAIRKWCEDETEMTARQALARGFVDGILGQRPRIKKRPRKRKTA